MIAIRVNPYGSYRTAIVAPPRAGLSTLREAVFATMTRNTMTSDLSIDSAIEPALFLDFDGTLVDIAARPELVHVPITLVSTLRRVHYALDGAVAIVSGRPLSQLDSLLAPLLLPAAGMHGFERRTALGEYLREPLPEGRPLNELRAALHKLTQQHVGVWLEDKRFALALHYRQTEHLGPLLQAAAEQLLHGHEDHFELQPGRMVLEFRPRHINKGHAIRHFMAEAPFKGRRPIAVGDDYSDEHAFATAHELGGTSIAVAPTHPSIAATKLDSAQSVRDWLAALAA